MKIVLAFDSFKGCMSAAEACRAAARGILAARPRAEVVECPLSDGGEGLVDCVAQSLPCERVAVAAHDPLMAPITASYVVSGRVAYMEMAATSALTLVPQAKRNPLLTTTYGVGDMIADALERGYGEIVMGIGGSATCDGGRGMLECLRDRAYLDARGRIANRKLAGCRITVACDVKNPLYGAQGAAYVFAPQKGATPAQVEVLDARLRDFARETERAGLASPELAAAHGAGAAGGLGYGLMAYLKAELKSGIDVVLDVKGFDRLVEGADCVITGEGKSDTQTLMGKVPHGVLRRAKAVPVYLLSGGIENRERLAEHFALVKSINEGDPRPLDVLMQPAVAKENLENACKNIERERRENENAASERKRTH